MRSRVFSPELFTKDILEIIDETYPLSALIKLLVDQLLSLATVHKVCNHHLSLCALFQIHQVPSTVQEFVVKRDK